MKNIFQIKDVSYTYSSGKVKVEAVKDLQLEVGRGEIFGFIGPNGAGKTTTIKLLLGLLLPQGGSVELFGLPPSVPEARKSLGFMPEMAYYYKFLTAKELLSVYGRIFGMGGKSLHRRIVELLDLVGIGDDSGRLIGSYSKGMMQKVSFAQALINDPELLVLDEPTSGLDPVARLNMRKILQSLKEKGKTVFFSSHELSEVELISDRIGIMHKGKVRAVGTPGEIMGKKGADVSLENFFLDIVGT